MDNKMNNNSVTSFSSILKSMMGSVFEWYQFCIYGYFAPVIAKVFFPKAASDYHMLLVYAVFFAGYLARPIGGIFFSIIGDKFGRKCVLVWTLLMMAIPTTCIGLLPGYDSIGMISPILLIVFRMIQGLSMGGNYGGSLTFVFEMSSLNKRGFTSSISVISILIGLFLASSTIAAFDYYFDDAALQAYGFRIPFLLGFFVGLWAIVLQKTLPESPVFKRSQEAGTLIKNPIKTLFLRHSRNLFTLLAVVILHDLSFYILFVYMMNYFSNDHGFTKQIIFSINAASLVLVAISTLFFAWYSDKIGRIRIMKGAAVFFIVATLPLLIFMTKTTHDGLLFLCYAILALGVGAFLGPLPALMVETFPSTIRNTAITTTGNISGPLFGGSAPLIVHYLTEKTHLQHIPALYLTLSACCALLALYKLNPHYTMDADTDEE